MRARGRLHLPLAVATVAFALASVVSATPALGGVAGHGPARTSLSGTSVPVLSGAPAAVPAIAVNKIQTRPERTGLTATTSIPGYSPTGLRSAYNLAKAAATAGGGKTVAVVSAYADPKAAADLAVYRAHWKLPACTVATGCLRLLNEHGAAKPLPAANSPWALEQSIELDAISALCPKCKLLVVQAASNSVADLGAAENTAVAKGARFVADGWSELEFNGELADAHYFDHPGTAIVAAAGNNGYGSTFPAALATVTAVGGTTLTTSAANARGWAETAWAETGSACAIFTAKPSWQRTDAHFGSGCLNRTENDVAADADPSTGAAVYDSYGTGGGWTRAGGNALAAAIVTAAYALAGVPAAGSYPASYPYQHAARLYDVKFGPIGCSDSRQYLCTAEPGYDGPTGLGTPDGTGAFTAAGTDPVTVTDPGTQDLKDGTTVTVRVTGLDTRTAATSLTWSATGLPAGLSVRGSGKAAVITGTLPAAVGAYPIVVTAKDPKTGKTGTTHFSIGAAASLALAAPYGATFETDTGYTWGTAYGGACLDGGASTAGTIVTASTPCYGTAEQLFAYQPEGAPGAPANLTLNGLCVTPVSRSIELAKCMAGAAGQGWGLLLGDLLQNAGTGTCLATSAEFSDPLTLAPCDAASGYQRWVAGYAKIVSGVGGMCASVDDTGTGANPFTLEPCGQSEPFGIGPDGTVIISLFRCMGEGPGAANCDGKPDQDWLWGPGGELVNESTGTCLDDPGNATTAGTDLTTLDCYGLPGEVWARA